MQGMPAEVESMIEYRRYPELPNGLAVTASWKIKLAGIVPSFHRATR
jgi:hypothetical protein